jgi:alkyl hydroperoxide reductase subunit AhpC
MLTVGDKSPEYSLKATVGTDLKNAFTDVSDQSYQGKWKLYFFCQRTLLLCVRPGSRLSPSSTAS